MTTGAIFVDHNFFAPLLISVSMGLLSRYMRRVDSNRSRITPGIRVGWPELANPRPDPPRVASSRRARKAADFATTPYCAHQ